jgi:site-specific recombinase XerD
VYGALGDDGETAQPGPAGHIDHDASGGAVVPASSPLPADVEAELAALVAAGEELRARRHAEATRKAYESDFAHFADWCAFRGLADLPAQPEAVWLYLTAGYKVSTLERRLSAIKWVHETNGHASPTPHPRIRELMAGIRRRFGTRPDKVDHLATAQVAQMIATLDLDTLSGLRDRALLLVGYAGAFRCSELAALTRDQLRRSADGYLIQLGRTKDDQEARGRDVGIPGFPGSPLCPVAALDTWLTAAGITDGPIFRRVTRYQTVGASALSGASVARIVKRAARDAGIPPDRLAGHSLRAGHATTAAQNRAPDRTIMRRTGHRRLETLDGYIRPATVFIDNSARFLGLDEDAQQ